MKRKYKKTKKGHARRNATIKRKKRTRRQRGGAPIVHVNLTGNMRPIDGNIYEFNETDTYETGSPKYEYSGRARAIVMHPPCGVESRCEPLVSYTVVDGPCIYKRYEPDGTYSTYEGTWVDSKKNGHGKLTYSDGTVYDGNWEDDAMSGIGKLTQPPVKNEYGLGCHAIYDGHWANNLKSGRGTNVYHDCSVYTGEWVNDEINGKGKMQYSDGDVYEGDFMNEEKHGSGKYTFHTHPVFQEYEGNFEDGMMQGQGKLLMKNRDRYVGAFQNGMMHGKGIMNFHDKTRYEGDWDQGRMHGHRGIFYDHEGKQIYDGPVANNGPAPAPAPPAPLFQNSANIFQNTQQNTGNIFGRRPDFFGP